MTERKVLRPFKDVKRVAAPSGVGVTTRLWTSAADELVLSAVAGHVSRLRRQDLAERSTAGAMPDKELLSARKRALTAVSSARWASAIIRGNDDQFKLARRAQRAHIVSLTAAVSTITARLAEPSSEVLSPDAKPARVKGYRSQSERFEKQRRLQHLQAELADVQAAYAAGRVSVVDGGARLFSARNNLAAAKMSPVGWRQRWDCERDTIRTVGSPDEAYGNLTFTVEPSGKASVRLPKPLEHLANAKRGRYVFDATVEFKHRHQDWTAQIHTGAVAYRMFRQHGRDGWYLTASWSCPTGPVVERTHERVAGVDLNADHLACWIIDRHGNPVGTPRSIPFTISGSSSRRDAQIRHAISQLIRWAQRHDVTAIAVEDLNFVDARAAGRETMGRGARGKQFRRTVAGIPTAVFRNRLAGMVDRAGIDLTAVNPAYTSMWGDEHWRRPTTTTHHKTTRHEAAAIVIARRSLRHRARRRPGVTVHRPEDRQRRATGLTEHQPQGKGKATGQEQPHKRLRSTGTNSRHPQQQQTGQPSPRQLEGHSDLQGKQRCVPSSTMRRIVTGVDAGPDAPGADKGVEGRDD